MDKKLTINVSKIGRFTVKLFLSLLMMAIFLGVPFALMSEVLNSISEGSGNHSFNVIATVFSFVLVFSYGLMFKVFNHTEG